MSKHLEFPVCPNCQLTIGVWVENDFLVMECGCESPEPGRLVMVRDDEAFRVWILGEQWKCRLNKDTLNLDVFRSTDDLVPN